MDVDERVSEVAFNLRGYLILFGERSIPDCARHCHISSDELHRWLPALTNLLPSLYECDDTYLGINKSLENKKRYTANYSSLNKTEVSR